MTRVRESVDDSEARVRPKSSQLIIDIASAAAGELDLDQILHETLDRLGAVVPLTGGSIALLDGDELVVRAAIGPFADEVLGQRLPRGPSRSWHVVDTLEPFHAADLHAQGLRVRGARPGAAIRSWLAAPIVRRGVGIGLIEIDSTEPGAFGPADVVLLVTIVRILAGPVELADHHAAEQQSKVLRDAFIGVISHELRTPITTIYGLSKMLHQRGEMLDPSVRVRVVEDIEAEADRLHRLVEDLLILSRAERGPVEVSDEPVSIVRVLRRAIDAESGRIPDRRFVLELPDDLGLVTGEETYVEQVTRNLLTNAAKYSASPTPIRIHGEIRDGEVVIRVLDEGIGIGQDDAEHAFELFYRSTTATRTASGAGIGLFVCRQLIDAMGGRIWAAPRIGGGSEVGFALPSCPPEDDEN